MLTQKLSEALFEQHYAVKAQNPDRQDIINRTFEMAERACELEEIEESVQDLYAKDMQTTEQSVVVLQDWLAGMYTERQDALEALISLFGLISPEITEADLTVPRLHLGITSALQSLLLLSKGHQSEAFTRMETYNNEITEQNAQSIVKLQQAVSFLEVAKARAIRDLKLFVSQVQDVLVDVADFGTEEPRQGTLPDVL